ncbi:MAG: hypothetical protein RBR71_13390 [Gudongella sp.]|nr:hypothetical protein [Gudongella sp.]
MRVKDSLTLHALNGMDYGSVPFIGTGKTFKTGTMFSIIEKCPDLYSRPKAFYNYPDVSIFPADYQAYAVDSLDDIIPGSILIGEDANRIWPSRQTKDSTLQRFMGVISHKDILAMFTLQNTSNVDQCIFRDQRVVNIHKPTDLISLAYERDEFRPYCQLASDLIPRYAEASAVDWHYVSFVPVFSEILIMDPAPWYGYVHSHGLRDVRILDKGVSA